MLNVSDALKKAYRTNLEPYGMATIKTQIVFPDLGVGITNDRIVKDSLFLTERLFTSEDMEFGACESSEIEFTVADVPEDLNGQTFTVSHLVNNTYTVPLGTFTVDTCEKQDDLRFKDIIAYDNMKKFDIDVAEWYNKLQFPITVKDMRTSLCSYCGVEQENVTLINDSVRVEKTLEVTELVGREVLVAIAEINGVFGHINRQGKLTYIGLDGFGLYPSETLYPADDLYPTEPIEIMEKGGENKVAYISSKYEDFEVMAIDGVIVQDDESTDGGLTVGTAKNPYLLVSNMLIIGKSNSELTMIAERLLGQIGKVVYTPHETQAVGLPYIEVGDTVLNMSGADKELLIAERVLTGISSVMDSFSARGNPKRENYGKVPSTEFRKLKGVTMKLTKAIDRIGVEIENLETDTNTRFEVADGRITAEIARAQSAEASLQISINGIRSDVSNLASDTSTRFQQTDSAISAEARRAMEAETQLRLTAEGLRVDVDGKIDGADARSIFAVEIGKITLSASQINLNGYFTANGNFTIDTNGDMALVGDGYRVDLRSVGMYVGNQGVADLATYIKAGTIAFADEQYKTLAEIAGIYHDKTVKIGQKGHDSLRFELYGDDVDCYNLFAVDGDFKTLKTITLQCTALNNATPITAANIRDYLGTFNSSNTKISYTSVGNINIMSTDGFIAESSGKYGNIASTGWVQGKVADLREEIAELRALISG